MTRRDALRLFGAGGVAAVLAGCTGGGSPSNSPSGGGATDFPTGDVQLRWLGGVNQRVFFEPWFEDYNKEHPNVSLTFDGVNVQDAQQLVTLGVQNGNAHDVFATPTGVPASTMISEGWVAPLDDILPDVEEWKARFKPAFQPFLERNGKVYSCPVTILNRVGTLLYYNRPYMNDAGYDPESEPLSWDDLRDAARKITQAGNGDYYGFVIGAGQPNLLANWVQDLGTFAGSGTANNMGAPFDWRTGEFTVTDEHVGALELLLAMVDDGSVLPGFNAMKGPDANESLPQGRAGLEVQIAQISSLYVRGMSGGTPDFDFGVGQPPTPDPGAITPNAAGTEPAQNFWAFADSPNLAVVGDLLDRLASPEAGADFLSGIGLAGSPAMDGVLELLDLSDIEQHVSELVEGLWVTAPAASLRNPDTEAAMLQWRLPNPDLGVTVQGVLAGELEPAAALQDVADRFNQALDDVVAAAQKDGLDIDRDTWVFPNWDPMKHYTSEMYDEL